MCVIFALFWLFGTIIPYAANHPFGATDHSVYAPRPSEQDRPFEVVIGLISGSSVFNHTGMFIGVSRTQERGRQPACLPTARPLAPERVG